MKKKILITYDAPDWAYHKNAKVLKKYLSDEFDISLIYDQDKLALVSHLKDHQYDLVFFQWYKDIDFMMASGLIHKQKCISQIATTYIFDREIEAQGWHGYRFWPYMVAKNKELYERLYVQRNGIGVDLAYHVNDHEIFFSQGKKKKKKDFRVAYVGHTENPRKGFHLIKKACEDANVELLFHDHSNKISYENLPDFYRSADVTICASNMEGAPNPMIESGLVGTPIITTRVGQIQEMVKNRENAIIVERNTDAIRDAIIELKQNDELYDKLSANIAKTCFDWNILALNQWREIFRKCIVTHTGLR